MLNGKMGHTKSDYNKGQKTLTSITLGGFHFSYKCPTTNQTDLAQYSKLLKTTGRNQNNATFQCFLMMPVNQNQTSPVQTEKKLK
jgi:hypothetical protein